MIKLMCPKCKRQNIEVLLGNKDEPDILSCVTNGCGYQKFYVHGLYKYENINMLIKSTQEEKQNDVLTLKMRRLNDMVVESVKFFGMDYIKSLHKTESYCKYLESICSNPDTKPNWQYKSNIFYLYERMNKYKYLTEKDIFKRIKKFYNKNKTLMGVMSFSKELMWKTIENIKQENDAFLKDMHINTINTIEKNLSRYGM